MRQTTKTYLNQSDYSNLNFIVCHEKIKWFRCFELDKICIVTGGGGFIGRGIVKCLLAKNYLVKVIDLPQANPNYFLDDSYDQAKISFHGMDLNEITAQDESVFNSVDCIFHCADD